MAQPALAVPAKPSLTIKRRYAASPERCFRAWTDPQALSRWFGPPNCEIVRTDSDARVGGRYCFVMRSPAGSEFDVSGTFHEVVASQRLVYTWVWSDAPERESLVTVEFKPDGEGTLLTLLHEQFADEEARDRHNAGWIGALDKFAVALA